MWFSLAHQFLPSCCYYCAITKDRVRLDRFLCLNRKCRQANQIAETVCVFVVKTPLWLWTQGLKHTSFRHTASYELLTPLGNVAQGIGTAERADRATCSWMCWINIFDSKAASVEGVVVTLYLFIALKITPEHNVHRKMPPYTACRIYAWWYSIAYIYTPRVCSVIQQSSIMHIEIEHILNWLNAQNMFNQLYNSIREM